MEQLEWCKKLKICYFTRFDRKHERDGQTDGRTDRQTQHDGIDRAYA